MWSYIARRLLIMIPTLFGVTVVSFCIMQLAPGDPIQAQAGAGGSQGASTGTREAYLIMKRDLKLDKPLLLNVRYFRDYSAEVRHAAYFKSLSMEEIVAELAKLANAAPGSIEAQRRDALVRMTRQMDLDDFERRLADRDQHPRLAIIAQNAVQVFCENTGTYAVPDVMRLLDETDDPRLRIGAIRALNGMVFDSFVYTYSRDATDGETAAVVGTWTTWWERAKADYSETNDERRAEVRAGVAALAEEPSKSQVYDLLDEEYFEGDVPYFVEILLGESSLEEKEVASVGLLKKVGRPLRTDVPLDAKPAVVENVAENWRLWYQNRRREYEPSVARKLWLLVADTQYAHMVWRLATFNFGRSALRTREPVAEKIWDAAKVSAPLYLLAQVLVYAVAVPLGVFAAVRRGKLADRGISLGLFMLYSIPPFVAGMLFLLYFAYGRYFDWFPVQRLHSSTADSMNWPQYLVDYAWHLVLPVTCLSLFSLAGLAMYSRSSMLEVIGQDFIRTARAKGLSGRVVVLKHALRNALIPVITLFSNLLPAMLGGSVLIEVIFGIPGMGRLGWASIEQKDFPTLMALIYVDAIVVMLSILLTDLLYVLVDPRISFGGRGQAA